MSSYNNSYSWRCGQIQGVPDGTPSRAIANSSIFVFAHKCTDIKWTFRKVNIAKMPVIYTEGDLLPPWRVKSETSVFVPINLRGKAILVQGQWGARNEQRGNRIKIALEPAMQNEIRRDNIRKRLNSSRVFPKAKGFLEQSARWHIRRQAPHQGSLILVPWQKGRLG